MVLLVAAPLAAASPAGAAQLDARERPTSSGPLTFEGKSCVKQKIRSGGRVLAEARACVFLYSLSPAAELDPFRDYGAAWAQTELDPARGWCASKVRSGVFLPQEAEGHARAPKRRRVDESRRVTTKLAVDARGTAIADASLRQRYLLHPEGITGRVEDGGRTYTVKWTGRTPKTVAFALGLEFSVPAGDALLGEVGGFGAGFRPPLALERC